MNETRDASETAVIEGEFVEAHKRRRGGALAWVLLFLLVAFIGGLFAAPYAEEQLVSWGILDPRQPPAARDLGPVEARLDDIASGLAGQDERLAALNAAVNRLSEESAAQAAQLGELARRLRAMEAAALAPGEEGEAALAALEGVAGRVGALAERVAALEAGAAAAPAGVDPAEVDNLLTALEAAANERQQLIARTEALTRRLATLEAAGRTAAGPAPLAAEIAALVRRVDAGKPFPAALAAVRARLDELGPLARANAASALAVLEPYAASGVPTADALAARFDALAARILRTPAQAEAGWLARLRQALSGVVVVRETGAQEGDTPQAVVARAEAALRRGDLAMAIAELEALPPGGREAAAEWLASAQARLAAERAADELLTLLAARPAGEAP